MPYMKGYFHIVIPAPFRVRAWRRQGLASELQPLLKGLLMNSVFRFMKWVVIATSTLFSFSVSAADWPQERPVRIVVPWPAGSGTDNVARLIAEQLSTDLKQQFIVENRPGAGGVIGMRAVSSSQADGYTLMLTSSSYAYLINRESAGVDLIKDFIPVSLLATFESALVVNPELPVETVGDLLERAKAEPGVLNYASTGIGGFGHMNTELFKYETNTDIVHVPYLGGAQATLSVVSGDTQIYLGSLLTTTALINEGRLKLLAVGGAERNPDMPDVPTIGETVPGYETFIWFGMFAPSGTPPAIVERLHATINEAIESPELKKRLEAQGAHVMARSSQEFGDLVVSEATKGLQVIEAAGIQGN